MTSKQTLPLLLLAALAMMVRAADTPPPAPTVAVYDFTGEADAASYGKNATTLVTADLTTETNLVLVERAELTQALREQAFGVSGMVSPDAAAKIGQITGAKVLVSGQALKIGDNHLVIVAYIIGTETGRLFAAKVEGAPAKLMDLSTQLSRHIAQTITDQRADLLAAPQESKEERLARVIRTLPGTNRPSVSISVTADTKVNGPKSGPAESELGMILLKAGFPVVDSKSDRKPDIVITGVEHPSAAPKQGALFSFQCVDEIKVQDRRKGAIIGFAHEEATATGASSADAKQSAQVQVIDAVAEQVLPLLAN